MRPRQPTQPRESVSVEIYDQVYHLRGIDPEHLRELAAIVDAKMRAVAAQGMTVDSLRVAVLASLNLADESQPLRERCADLERQYELLRQSHELLRNNHERLRHSYEQMAGSISATQNSLRSRSASLSGMLDELLETAGAGAIRRVS
jgi:cell division protein ZapA